MNVIKTTKLKGEDWVRAFQRKLYCAAKQNTTRGFGILYDKIVRMDVLQEAWKRVSRNGGSSGVDGKSIQWIRKEYGIDKFLLELQEELNSKNYQAKSIRRVYIPKDNGETRPLGIPTVKDRVAQMAVKLIIEPLFEADFMPCSYGFRPKRSNKAAVEQVHKLSNYNKWIVDIDLKGYFDTIPHDKLMALVRKRVRDKSILHLIRKWLKAGVMDNGQLTVGSKGTPQGGVLSPLLSNIYLHELDRKWDNHNGKIVRFADDIVILCKSQKQAERALEIVQRIVDELGLTLNQDKTKIGHVKDGFDFLGFTYKESYSPRCKRLVRIKYPRAKSMKKVRQRIKDVIRSFNLGTPIWVVIDSVNRTLRGWANYFAIGNSYRAAEKLSWYVGSQLRLFWRRHKQVKRIHGGRRWPNAMFYKQGLYYVPKLIRPSLRMSNTI